MLMHMIVRRHALDDGEGTAPSSSVDQDWSNTIPWMKRGTSLPSFLLKANGGLLGVVVGTNLHLYDVPYSLTGCLTTGLVALSGVLCFPEQCA
jgi:hypothetical protein